VLASGVARCWGANSDGQLGNGTTTGSPTPVNVANAANFTAITASQSFGDGHTCGRRGSGQIVCWGANNYGQLGTGTTTPSLVPVATVGLTATGLSAGREHTCAVVANATLRCWGVNGSGQLGNGTSANALLPTLVTSL
jgi:alpha-tubulin suppressor-like RCC1 family protein